MAMPRSRLVRVLWLVAFLDAGGVTASWWLLGAHRGWTQTQVERVRLDEVTGLEAREWEHRFVPGVDVLGAGWLGAAVTAGLAVLLRNKSPKE